jgi:DNA-binding response OmpR family regulator
VKTLVLSKSVTMCQILSKMLFALGYSEIHCAQTNDNAQDLLAGHQFNLIVVDWATEEARDFIKATRKHATNSTTPIVAMVINDRDSVQIIAAGVNACLVKPFSPEELQRTIQPRYVLNVSTKRERT